jgi:hypothetical protein
VYVTSDNDTEIQLTLEALLEFANALLDADDIDTAVTQRTVDTRTLLSEQGFSRAAPAPEAAIRRVTARMIDLLPRLDTLPGSDVETAQSWVNAELTELSISPSLTDHDSTGLHIHWTQPSATFDDQVMADLLMALAQELCDHGTKRFGHCAASDCRHLFYDATRNGSRRFCSDSRCASRTHTADHRKRKKKSRTTG